MNTATDPLPCPDRDCDGELTEHCQAAGCTWHRCLGCGSFGIPGKQRRWLPKQPPPVIPTLRKPKQPRSD